MRIGTCHFLSFAAAVRYYRDYVGNEAPFAVLEKLRDGDIKLGAPVLKDGERAVLIDGGTRWAIEWKE